MQYNKNKFNKVNDKKVMKKVKKQWVVVSVATLAILGASAYSMISTQPVVAHADATQATSGASDDLKSSAANQGSLDGTAGVAQSTVSSAVQSDYNTAYDNASTAASTAAYNEGSSDFSNGSHNSSYANHQSAYDAGYNAASTTAKEKSDAASEGSSDGTLGKSQATVSSAFQNDYNAAYSAASTSASIAASSAGSSDFAANKGHNTSYANHQDAYDSAYSLASSTASSVASSNATSNGISDYINGNSKNSSVGSVNQDTYNSAYSQASSGFNDALNKSTTSGAKTSDVNYQAGSSYEVRYSAAIAAAVSDAVNSTNNANSYSSDSVGSEFYSAAYAGAQAAMNAYNQKTQNQGTGTQDYTYYKNTANKAPVSGGSNDGGQEKTTGNTTGGTTNQKTTNTNTATSSASYQSQVKANTSNVTGGYYINGSSTAYNSSAAASYTANYNDSYVAQQGGADDPKTAHDTAVSYDNDLNNKFGTTSNTSVKLNGQNSITVATPTDVAQNAVLKGALSSIYNYSVNAALALQGMKDAEAGKWTGVQTPTNIPSISGTTTSTTGATTVDYYAKGHDLSQSDNPYDQAYLGALAAIKAGFSSSNSYQSISNLPSASNFSSYYQNAYQDVQTKQSQGTVIIQNAAQLDNVLKNYNLSNKLTIKFANDINLHDVYTSNSEYRPSINPSNYTVNITLDGQNHMADFAEVNYNVNSSTPSSSSFTVQNFQVIYGQNWYGPVSLTGAGSITYNNISYIGAQLLSAPSNDVYINGNVNVSQRDTTYNSPFAVNQVEQGDPGDQLNLDIKNMVLGAGAHYFGSTSYYEGDAVVKLNNSGNLTLGENSSMTLVPRGYNRGNDDSLSSGIDMSSATLSVNKNANLNIIPDIGAQDTTAFNGAQEGAGGITMSGSSKINVNGGSINIEANQYPYSSGAGYLLYNSGGNVTVTNGGLIQVKAANLGTNSGGGLVYVSGGSVNIADRGNLIVSIPDGSGSTSSTGMNLINGNLNVNDSGDSHVILDTGGNSNTNFVYGGSINAYTAKVNGTVYYRYTINSSKNVTSTDEYLNQGQGAYPNGNRLDISSVPSVYFSGPLTAKRNGNTITVTGLAKVSGYDSTAPDNHVYIQYGTDNNTASSYRDNGMTYVYTNDDGQTYGAKTSNSTTYQNSTKTQGNPSSRVDNNVYSARLDAQDGELIPISFTVSDPNQSIQTVGVYLRYGVNGVTMVATPSTTGGSDYSSSIEGYTSTGAQDPSATIQTASGSGASITAGTKDAINDAISGGQSYDPTKYQRDLDYTYAYQGVLAGYKSLPALLQQAGITDPTQAPNPMTNAMLEYLKGTDAFKTASNPNAFLSGAQTAYSDYLANQDALKALTSTTSTQSSNSDSAYTNNYNAATSATQQGMADAATNSTANAPKDATALAVYNNAKAQYATGKTGMGDAAQGINNPAKQNDSAYQAGQTAYNQIVNDIRSGKTTPSTDTTTDPLKSMNPLARALYQQEFANVQAKFNAGASDALSGKASPSDPQTKDGFSDAKDGFDENTSNNNQNSPAYQAGQNAKQQAQAGLNAALADTSVNTNPSNDTAKNQAIQATKDAYAAVEKGNTSSADTTKPLAYQYAYNQALASAQKQVQQAQKDYKNGTISTQSGNGQAAKAYSDTVTQAKQGAQAANALGSSATPDANQSPAYKMGYNIAKGTADAEAGQTSQQPNNSDYQTAFTNFNSAKALGENAHPNANVPSGLDQAGKDGFAYGQGISALKNSQTPDAVTGLTGKTAEGYADAKAGYDDAMSGATSASKQTPAALEGFKYAKALTDGAAANTRPTQATNGDDLTTEKNAYDDVQSAINQVKTDIAEGKTGNQLNPNNSDSSAHNKDVYDKAYDAAVKAYQATNLSPSTSATDAGINTNDPIGKATFDKVKADALKNAGATAFTTGQTNAHLDDSNYNSGYSDAQQGYKDALKGKNSGQSAAYATGQTAGNRDATSFQNAENNSSDNTPAANGATAAINAVTSAISNGQSIDNLSPDTDSTVSASYKNAYAVALEDAKSAAKSGIDSITNPSASNTPITNPAALARVYNAAKAQAQKGYAEGLTGKTSTPSPDTQSSEGQGINKGSQDKAKYNDALNDFAKGITDSSQATNTADKTDPVYQEALKALNDVKTGNTNQTSEDNQSPVYAVAYSQALAKKQALADIAAANNTAGVSDPTTIDTNSDKTANVPDKQSFIDAYNNAIAGYNAGKGNSNDTGSFTDPADQQAFKDAKAAGQAARGADDLLDGAKTAKDVDGTTADQSYIAGVDDASAGYTDGLNGTKTASADVQATPAYKKAYAQGQADKSGVDAAKGTQNPDTNNAPDTLSSNAAKDAYLGYANAIAAVKNAHGNPSAIQTPANYSQKSSDYKAAYQKALEDAIAANKAGQNAAETPGQNDTKPTDDALVAVYDAAQHDTNKGMAEALSGKTVSDSSNANEQAGIQAGNPLQAAYQAAAKDFANGITDPAKATQTFSDHTQEQAYRDALAGMRDGSQTPASDTNDPKDGSPVYAIAKQQAQNVKNAVAAAQGSQNVANGQTNNAANDLANASGYGNDDNKPDMDSAYNAAANAYNDAISHTNGNQPADQSQYGPAAQMAYAQAYNAAKAAAAKGLTDFGNGNKAQQPANPADKAAYDTAQSDALAGLNAGLANQVDATKQQTNPAYKQGVDDAAAIQKAAEDAVNGTADAGKASLATDAQKAAYDNIKAAAEAGQAEYTANPDKYAGKTGDDLKNAANQAAQAKYPNDALKKAAFVQAIEAAGDAFGKGADAFGNGEQQPSGISAAGYQAAQQAYNAATNGTGKPEKVNGHYPAPEGVTPSEQYDNTFDAAYDKYKAAVDNAAQDTAANGGTATTAANSNDYKTATSMEQAAYNAAATKAAQGIAAAKLADSTKDAQYGTTNNGTFVPNNDTDAQAYAGAKAGYADGKTGATHEPTNVSAAYKAAYDKANADAKAAAQAGVKDFAQGLSAANPTEDAQAAKNAHSNGYSQAAAGYQAAINNPSGDFSSNTDASYQKGVEIAQAAAAARDNIVNNGDNAQPTQGETSSDPDVQGAAKAAAAAAKAALADGKDGKKLVNGPADVPAEFKQYAQIYADAYANVQTAAVQAAQDGAKAFASDGTEGNHNINPNDKSVSAVANQEGYKDAQTGYQDAQTNPDSASSNPNTGSVNGDEAAKGAAAAFNDVAGKDNAKPGDHATSDNNPVYEAAYQKALAEGKGNAADGAEALFNNNSNNSTANAATLAKPNATTAADKAFNKGLENAKDALTDAQANDPSKDAKYSGDSANTDAGKVYHATQDAYNAVLDGQQPLTDSALDAGDPVYAAAYKNALSRAQTASTNGATDTTDNGSSYAPNALAQAVYEKARSDASQAYTDALKNTDPSLAHHNGIDKASVAYQATQNAINDYLKNNGNAKEDPTDAGMDPANAQAYRAYYEKAQADVTQAATNGVNAYLGGTAIDDVPSVEGDNAGLGQVAKEAAQRAEKGHEDAVNNGARVSDANQTIAHDSAYLTGLKGAQDAAKGVDEAKADSTQQPATSAPQAEQDGFNGTVDGYNKAATDGSIKPADIDSYIADHLSNKSIAYRDAFKDAYLDGLNVAKAGADAANANQPNATKDQKGAAQKAQTQAYNDATNAFQDKLHGVEDNDVTSNTPAAEAGRQRASQYALALQDVADGHPNTGSTDADYQKGLATAQAAVAQAVADAKANKQLPADLTQIPVPDGSDPVAYRDAYAGILSGFYNGYNSKSTESGSQDAYYNVAFGIGFAKGKASIPTDTSAPLDFWKNKKAPKITDPAVAKAYKDQYVQAKAGFYDALYNKGDKSNNEYYKGSYKTAKDGLAGMKLAAKGDTKQNRNILKTKDAAFVSGYNGYLKGIEAAKRTLKKNKKLSAKDLLNKDKLYSYTFKEGLKHEVKVQRSHGKKAGVNKALERHAIPKDIYTHHSATYARTFVATYKKEMKRHMPRYIYNVGTIFTHNHVKFTNHTRIREYAYSARYNSTVFKVVGVKYYKNRIPRYRLSNGAVVTASQAVQNAYYKKHFKKYRVIKPTGVLIHTGKTFTKRNSVRRLYRGEVFHVRRVVNFHGITRLYVGKSAYITSNKTFVKAVIK
ncbi:DUF5776 domain-containing protein [Apilactobacillus nanyangensis]|uniref:DUF5776 domain-containing protein n=1 Tax=Apilactobacillus nanyangensis TaxID=2799579 RepID=A0ABT0HWV9_9LACO|nr:DUF5776 domain-containing protein [Apilactobacillus nanyangensis]MCK8611415.1 DUF5776 domain-containing protein [Apilactobacillus nanyangensis]